MQKFEYRCSLAECTVSLGAIVRSKAEISTVSSGADRSERSEDKNGKKNFWLKKFANRTLQSKGGF